MKMTDGCTFLITPYAIFIVIFLYIPMMLMKAEAFASAFILHTISLSCA